MWRTHLDVPKPDVILDSSYVALAVRRISRSPHYPFLHRRACEEICSVLHDQNGPGYAENPQPAMWESSSTSEIGLCIWFSRDGHRGLGCSLLVSKESGRRSPHMRDGYSGEGEHRFRKEAERRSGAKVNSSRSEATLAW